MDMIRVYGMRENLCIYFLLNRFVSHLTILLITSLFYFLLNRFVSHLTVSFLT
jgi:hypothetical protein